MINKHEKLGDKKNTELALPVPLFHYQVSSPKHQNYNGDYGE
tara:strand:+ start:234 stop:359 length:126 start_codon:yes stop_codon:yes gene_type:complete